MATRLWLHITNGDSAANTLKASSITETGRALLRGDADWIGLNGIDRWLGGVHLTGEHEMSRWDPGGKRLRH